MTNGPTGINFVTKNRVYYAKHVSGLILREERQRPPFWRSAFDVPSYRRRRGQTIQLQDGRSSASVGREERPGDGQERRGHADQPCRG